MGGHPYGRRGASCPGRSLWTSRTGRCGGTTGPEFKTKENILGWDVSAAAGHTDQLDMGYITAQKQIVCFISVNS